MQIKEYITNFSPEEIIERLKNGETLYDDTGFHIKYQFNSLCEYNKNNELVFFNRGLWFNSDSKYFLIEKDEEPEADESCIGKLCKFWSDDKDNSTIDILKEIDNTIWKYVTIKNCSWTHCRALSKEEALALIKEK